jgi:hypothetical protein
VDIQNFDGCVDAAIFERGQKYYRQGRIAELSCEDGVYAALVDGTECYDVMIEMDKAGKIVGHNCSCPYDKGDICKHRVAVMYAIRDDEYPTNEEQKAARERRKPKEKSPNELSIKEIVGNLSREELKQIVLKQASGNAALRDEIVYLKAPVTGDIQAARKLIMSHIRQSKRDGFIEYGCVDGALAGADIVIADAQRLAESGEYIKALELFLLTHGVVTEAAGYSDDGGHIMPRLEECMAGAADIACEIAKRGGKRLRKICFDRLVAESKSPVYNGWGYGVKLLACCVPFCTDKPFADGLWGELNAIVKDKNSDLTEYYVSKINQVKSEILALTDDKKVEDFD